MWISQRSRWPGKTDRKEKRSGNQLIISQNARISELHAQFLIEPTRPPCEMTTDDLSLHRAVHYQTLPTCRHNHVE